MYEITLDQLYSMWVNYCESRKLKYKQFKDIYKYKRYKLPTFGEYHTLILKEHKYRII